MTGAARTDSLELNAKLGCGKAGENGQKLNDHVHFANSNFKDDYDRCDRAVQPTI
jgi:hypothetical protein